MSLEETTRIAEELLARMGAQGTLVPS